MDGLVACGAEGGGRGVGEGETDCFAAEPWGGVGGLEGKGVGRWRYLQLHL